MTMSLKGFVVGALGLAAAILAGADAQAMPVGPLAPAAASAQVEPVYYHGYGYGYRRPFVRPFVRPYRRFVYRRPFVRPFVRPFYGYRRPFYGPGYRRF